MHDATQKLIAWTPEYDITVCVVLKQRIDDLTAEAYK
jgi:hypothetical protein